MNRLKLLGCLLIAQVLGPFILEFLIFAMLFYIILGWDENSY
jgi:hypothetical protein